MKHKVHTHATCTSNHTYVSKTYFNTHSSHGAPYTASVTSHETPSHVHHQLPLTPFPCWKLYENPFYVDGKLVPKYISRYLNPPLHRSTNFFTSASKCSPHDALSSALSPGSLSLACYTHPANAGDQHQINTLLPPHAPPLSSTARSHNLNIPATLAFWEHHEIHRLAQNQHASVPSDLVNVLAGHTQSNLAPSETLKCPSLHLDCKIPNIACEVSKQSTINMASCNIQPTLTSILQRLRLVEESQSRSHSAIAKLRLEIEDASCRIQELEFSHESALKEINNLLQRFGEQMTMSRRKEQEKVKAAFLRLREEIEEERSTCKLLKAQNKKLMKELEEANMAATDAGEELDRERQARELMEEVCNELAREIGEDKAEVEQLKQEQAKSREIVEEELKMMRMATIWRDERVRTKISEVQHEVEDKEHMSMSLKELQIKLEDFVSTISAVNYEPCKGLTPVDNIDKKQQSIIEQARMLRQALEVSMQKVHAADDEHGRTCCANALSSVELHSPDHEGKDQCIFHNEGELQTKPNTYMLDYSKKPHKNTRRLRSPAISGDDHENHVDVRRAREHVVLHDVQAQQEVVPDATENDLINALHRSPAPQELQCKSNHLWLAYKKKQGMSARVPSYDKRQARKSSLQHSILSSGPHEALKGAHRKQLSLHFDASHNLGDNNDAQFDEHLGPAGARVHSLSEDDVIYANTDRVNTHERAQLMHTRKHDTWNPAHLCTAEEMNDMIPYPNAGQEEVREDGGNDHHVKYHVHHEYENDVCASGEVQEHGESDDFFFEPVMNAGLVPPFSPRKDHCEARYTQSDDKERSAGYSRNCQAGTMVDALISTSHHSRKYNEMTKYSLIQEDNARTVGTSMSLRYSETPAKSSSRELHLPIKVVVPIPSQMGAKTHHSPKSTQSTSPIKQCFRPPPTSPDHNDTFSITDANANHATSSYKKCSIRSQLRGQGQRHINMEEIQYDTQTGDMKGEADQVSCDLHVKKHEECTNMKSNSLHAELLKARDLDVDQQDQQLQVHHQMMKAKSSTSSSFRFSPLRRSLTHSHASH